MEAICLDLSTCHVPSEHPEWGTLRVCEHEHGWVVFVSHRNDIPPWFRTIMDAALAVDALVVVLDEAGPICPNFQTYDW